MTFSDEFAIRSWLYSENIRQGHDSTLKNMRPSHLYFLKSKNSSARTSILMNISLIPRNRGLSKTSLMSYENPESAKTLNKREIIRDFSRFFPFKNLQEKTYDILIYFPFTLFCSQFFFPNIVFRFLRNRVRNSFLIYFFKFVLVFVLFLSKLCSYPTSVLMLQHGIHV